MTFSRKRIAGFEPKVQRTEPKVQRTESDYNKNGVCTDDSQLRYVKCQHEFTAQHSPSILHHWIPYHSKLRRLIVPSLWDLLCTPRLL